MHPATMALIALFVLFTFSLIRWAHVRAVRAQSAPANGVVRMATLDESSARADIAWWLTTALAVVPLLITAVLLGVRWNDLPLRLPIHWGFDGHANGWAARSPLLVFGPLIVATITVALLTLAGVSCARYSPGFRGRSTVLGTARNALRAAAWLISLLFCAAVALPLAKDSIVLVRLVIVASVMGSLVLTAFVIYRSLTIPQAVLAAARRATDDRFWTAGMIYRNPDDAAIWVPKRSGLGYTLNFAQPLAWVIVIGTLLYALLLPAGLHALL